MHSIIDDHRSEFEDAIEFFQAELSGLRTGRASAVLVEDIPVEAYGSMMNVKGVGSILVPDSKTIMVEPWDKTLLKEIEKAIRQAPIGVNPVVDGSRVRITLPALTEEGRKELAKIIGKKAEETHVAVRGIREGIKDKVVKMEKDREISEDERFRLQEALETVVKGWNEKIKKLAEEKEKEIMTI
jgi:ribosome recycling factor